MKLSKGKVVKDSLGNHYIVRDPRRDKDGRVVVESVATRETFLAPASELSESDRVAF